MDAEVLAAAILAAGFVSGERAPLHSGALDDTLREKFTEYYAFVSEQVARAQREKKDRSRKKGSRTR